MIAMRRKMSLMPLAFCMMVMLTAGMFMFSTGTRPANAALEIIAKVNGKAITNYEVDQRTAFLRMVTNLEDTEANRAQIRQDAAQMLIGKKRRKAMQAWSTRVSPIISSNTQ